MIAHLRDLFEDLDLQDVWELRWVEAVLLQFRDTPDPWFARLALDGIGILSMRLAFKRLAMFGGFMTHFWQHTFHRIAPHMRMQADSFCPHRPEFAWRPALHRLITDRYLRRTVWTLVLCIRPVLPMELVEHVVGFVFAWKPRPCPWAEPDWSEVVHESGEWQITRTHADTQSPSDRHSIWLERSFAKNRWFQLLICKNDALMSASGFDPSGKWAFFNVNGCFRMYDLRGSTKDPREVLVLSPDETLAWTDGVTLITGGALGARRTYTL